MAARHAARNYSVTQKHLLVVLALAVGILSTAAQPVPRLNSIAPEWIQRGTSLEVVLSGENLGSVTNFFFIGDPGLSAAIVPPPVPPGPSIAIESAQGGISRVEPAPPKDETRLVVKLTAAADASLTPREIRVMTPTGVSNPIQIKVGQWPEVREQEPNGSIEQAQGIALPVVVSGVIGAAAQVDHYRFKAGKGQELVFDVEAARRGSALDSSLVLLNAAGLELAKSGDENGLDSLMIYRVPEDGDYVLQVRDFRYQGGGNYYYRLSAGVLPYIESTFPLGGQRGKQVEVALSGRNLEGTSKLMFNIAPDAPLGRQEVRARAPKGFSNLVPFDVQDIPDYLEVEPNNTTDKANAISLPVAINGHIDSAKDIDRFKFKSDKDQKIICEVVAYRFGSPLDALLILADAKGAILQQNDDATGADARIEFDAKKDAEYLLAIRDLTDRGGDEFAYRLTLRPPAAAAEAGFSARFMPDTPRVSRGGLAKVRCEVSRNGFDGPVRFVFAGLPSGIQSDPIVLTAAPASGIMLISASDDAPLGTFPLKMTATAVINGKTVTRSVEPLSGDRGVSEAFLTVLEAPPFTLELLTLSAFIEQSQSAAVEVLVRRREGFLGEVKLSAEGFSAGRDPLAKNLDVGEATLKGTDTSGRITLNPKLTSEVGTRTAVIRGESSVAGHAVVQYSRVLPVTVTQVPFILSSTLTRLSITALPSGSQSSAGETATAIKLERRDGFTNEVSLALEGMAPGINVTLEKIPANGAETTLKLVATDKALTGTNVTFTVLGTAIHKDRFYRSRTEGITLTVSAPEPIEPSPKTAAVAPPAGAAK